jgi:adenosylcobyric acid synthase
MGQTRTGSPWLEFLERGGEPCRVADGAVSPTGRVWGCYLHGLFANDGFRRAWLASLRSDFRATPASAAARVQAALDRLADAVAEAIPVARLEQILLEGDSHEP